MVYVRWKGKSVRSVRPRKYNHFSSRKSSRSALVARARNISPRLYTPKGNMSLQNPFPLSKNGVVLRFTSTKRWAIPITDFNGGIGTSYNLFRCNGIHDPDAAVGGHQPMGHDQWSVIYNHYTVTKANVSAVFNVQNINGTATGCPMTFGLGIVDGTTVRNLDEDCMMDSNYKWARMGYGQLPTTTLRHSYNPWKWNNIKGKTLPDSLHANFGTDPTEQQYFHVWASYRNGDALALTPIVWCTVTIEYTCSFSEPKQVGRS